MSIALRRFPVVICLLVLLPCAIAAQKSSKKKIAELPASTSAGTATSAPEQTKKDEEDPLFKGLTWRLVGPFRGGRVLAVSGVVGEANTYYVGGVGGVVWRSTVGGRNGMQMDNKEK